MVVKFKNQSLQIVISLQSLRIWQAPYNVFWKKLIFKSYYRRFQKWVGISETKTLLGTWYVLWIQWVSISAYTF